MVTKIEAAEKQIDTSIKLLFENVDRLSAYTLAAAALEVTDDLCDKREDQMYRSELARLGCPQKVRLSFRYEMRLNIKPEHIKEAMTLLRKDQNFLKHADRDHDQCIQGISIEKLSCIIYFAIMNFSLLENRITAAMNLFFLWFAASRPEYISKDADGEFRDTSHRLGDLLSDPNSEESFRTMYKFLRVNAPYLFMA